METNLTKNQKQIINYLYRLKDDKGYVRQVSLAKMGRDLGIGYQGIMNATKALCKKDLLIKEPLEASERCYGSNFRVKI